MSDVRYWSRIGMPITKGQAIEIAEKMSDGDFGVVHDDDVEEFTTVSNPSTKEALIAEIDDLFDREANEEDTRVDDDINWILTALKFEQNRKKYIKAKKQEGMTLEEAKEEYETEKANIVRQALNLPDEPPEVPPTYDNTPDTEEE